MRFSKGSWMPDHTVRLIEDWRTALDKNQYIAAVLMDLSKAFDCLPHEILLDKLSGLRAVFPSLRVSYSPGMG